MRFTALVCVLFCLPSCGIVRATEKVLAQTGEVLAKVKEVADDAVAKYEQIAAVVPEIKQVITSAAKKADTDGDGETSPSEWLALILGGLGIGGGAAAEAARRLAKRNAESHQVKDAREAAQQLHNAKAEARLAALEKKAG